MGIFSFNHHKTIQCGEGGIILCNNEKFNKRSQMVKNHGGAVLPEWPDY